MAGNPLDRIKSIQAKLKAKAPAAPTTKSNKPTPKYDVKANKSPALFAKGRVPHVTSGLISGGDEGVSIVKAASYVAGCINDDKAKSMIDLSDRLKSIYGPYFPAFSGKQNALLVPASAAYLATEIYGQEIPGAKEIKKEVRDRLNFASKDFDADEARFVSQKMGGMYEKALNTLVDSAGGSTVPPPILGDLIDLQRTSEVFSQAGASNVDLPPNGRIQFPKLTGGSTAYWVGETASITPSQETTGTLNLEARKLAIRVPITNELMKFSSLAVEGMVRADMAYQGALAADLAMLQGTGGTQIKGLITYPTAASWSQGVDKLLSYSVTGGVFQPEDVENINALLPDKVESTAWCMRPNMWANIFNRRADAVANGDQKGGFVFNLLRGVQDGSPALFNGKKVVKSRNIVQTRGNGSQTYILTGYFPDWVIARMGIFEFMVDPYTQMQNYQTVIQAVQFIDAGPRHAASFVFADNITV